MDLINGKTTSPRLWQSFSASSQRPHATIANPNASVSELLEDQQDPETHSCRRKVDGVFFVYFFAAESS